MFASILSFLGGFFTALFAEPLRRWIFHARLSLEFKDAEHFITQTPEGSIAGSRHQACYIRCKVTNAKSALAKSCRAYLVNVERQGSRGNWEATSYCESMQLAWASRGDGSYTALDIPKDVPHFIDILSVREGSNEFRPAIQVMPFRYESLWSTHGTYRFTVIVSGEDVTPATLGVSLKWTGEWDKFEVRAVSV